MRTRGVWLILWLGALGGAFAQSASLTAPSTTYAAAGGSITLTATLTYSSQPSSLGFAVTLPAGWSYASGTSEPAVKPAAGQTGTLEWAYLDGFGATSVSFTATVNYPAGLTGPQTITAEAYCSSPFTTLSVASLVMNGAAAPTLAFASQPANQIVGAGESATFTATVEGSPAPTFQWQVSADAGGNWVDVAGATDSTLTLTNTSTAQSGNLYRLRAVRDSVTVYSNSAALTVNAAPVVAPSVSWTASSNQISSAGGSITVSVTFAYGTAPSSLGLEAHLPPGWTYQGGTSEPAVKPAVGDTGTLSWAYFDGFGTNSATFSFNVQYPAGQSGAKSIAGQGFYLSPESTMTPPNLNFSVIGSTFAAWRNLTFSGPELASAAVSGPGGDPDRDGLVNLIEYALGLNPTQPGSSSGPEISVTASEWIYTYTRPADRSDLNYSVNASANLTDWTLPGVIHERVATGSTETWRGRYPRTGAPQVFFRLEVSTRP
jgi:hypothetical protein